MPFAIGDDVHVRSLGKGTIRGIRSGGRYLVEIKGRSVLVAEAQLSGVDRRDTPPQVKPAADPETTLPTRAHVPGTFDLHGLTASEADAALTDFLSDAILAGHHEARVIHGRSGGRLKAIVHARLRVTAAVRSFRVDPRNPGVTIVVF